jgi:hypothetical protein
MNDCSEVKNVETVLTSNVLDEYFRKAMASVAAFKTFSCVLYDGRLYDFDYYSKRVRGNFEAGVTWRKATTGSGELLSILLSHYLANHPSSRLFAHNFVSYDEPFPSIGATEPEMIRAFIGRCSSMPLNLLICDGNMAENFSTATVAIADISDGDAWLLVFSE